jgi:hypothetical protein
LRSSHPKKTRDRASADGRVPFGAQAASNSKDRDQKNLQERAFLVGIDVRTRGRSAKGTVTAQAQAARDAASAAPPSGNFSASGKPGNKPTNKPSIPEFDAEESLAELRALAESAGAKVVGEILQRRDRPDPATLIGGGKLEEIAGAAASVNADLLLFDHDLTASQQRNIEKIVQRRVIDRTQLILDIFARHARTREGQLQVELAQLHYLMPRLAGRGVEMSQLGEKLRGACGTSSSNWKMCGARERSNGSAGNRLRWRLWRWWDIRTRANQHCSMRSRVPQCWLRRECSRHSIRRFAR